MQLPALLPITVLAWLLADSAGAGIIHFDDQPAGIPPAGWTTGITGTGEARWTVEPEATAPSAGRVLKQSAWTPKPSYPVCLLAAPLLRDGFVEVKFKALSGTNDQAAGIVWRAQDTHNYYICRANALEDNVVLYKIVHGQRTALDIVGRTGGYGVEAKVPPGRWQTLRVEFAGSRFKVRLDGWLLFEVEDATFAGAGKVGLWTKADSVTFFDDFRWDQETK